MKSMHRSFGKDGLVPVGEPTVLQQVAALCLRDGPDGLEVLLVKSSRGRWILPKGWPMDDVTDAEAARLEAWEEAGVEKGKLNKTPVGAFVAQKRHDDGAVSPCFVSVFRIDVSRTRKDYPEASIRRRKWMSLKKAAKRVQEPGLKALLKSQFKIS